MAKLIDSWVLSYYHDHFILWYSVYYNVPLVKRVEFSSGLVIDDRTLADFADALSSVDWGMTINSQDAELAFNQFHGKFMELFHHTIPECRTYESELTIRSWVTPDLMDIIMEQNKLFH